mgnify:CR=1 FL=1
MGLAGVETCGVAFLGLHGPDQVCFVQRKPNRPPRLAEFFDNGAQRLGQAGARIHDYTHPHWKKDIDILVGGAGAAGFIGQHADSLTHGSGDQWRGCSGENERTATVDEEIAHYARAKHQRAFAAQGLAAGAQDDGVGPSIKIGGKPAPYDSPTIMVGAADSYEARCRACHIVPRATEGQQQLL